MASKTKDQDPVRQYLSEIGKRGGQASNPGKGFGAATMSEERRKEIAKKAAAGRRRAFAARAKAKKAAK